jgi:hypothetical protein
MHGGASAGADAAVRRAGRASRNGYFIKLPALRLALAEYGTVGAERAAASALPACRAVRLSVRAVVRAWALLQASAEARLQVAWVDMDGYAPFSPRPASRACVPFTSCWPDDAQMVGAS